MFRNCYIAFLILGGACLLFLTPVSSWAQGSPASAPARPAQPAAQPAAPPQVASDPTSTAATFGDWVLRCVKLPDQQTRACEVTLSMTVEGQQSPIAQVAVGRTAPRENLRLTVAFPNNVTLTASPRVTSGEDDKQPVVLTYQRCIPGVCLADAAFSDSMRDRWRKAGATASVTFTEGGGRAINLPISLRGLPQALDALGSN